MRPLSLTARLSLLFALCSALVLLGLGWVAARSVERHFLELDREELGGKMALVGNLLSKTRTPEDLAALPQELDDALVGHPGLAVTVETATGALRYARDGAGISLARASGGDARGPWIDWNDGERAWRGLRAQLPLGLATAAPATVAIALDITRHRRFMSAFRDTLALAVGFAALIAAALGWVVTRGSLRPLKRVTALAASLDASRLDARLPQTRLPEEIAALATTFNAMLARLEDSFRRLSEFSSDIAHELRTPVGNLMIQAQVALSTARSIEQYREVLYSSLEEYERMAQTIGDMLFLAQADNGLLRPSTAAVDLAAEVGALFEYLDAWAEERGVALALDGAACVPGDRLMLRRALSNLLVNAIRHTPAGRTVRVRLETDVRVARVAVENPGTPIPAEYLPRLFDRFYRLDPARSRDGEGAGLGLAIVKSIVDAHAGTVAAASGEAGTRFVVVLPTAGAN